MVNNKPLQTVDGPIYQNHIVLSPNGECLFRCNARKSAWYLDNKLAKIVNHNPFTIQLTFSPKGLGHFGDPFYMQDMKNLCVICGTEEELTKHHVVPRCYRKHFPDKIKIGESHDVLLTCIPCHLEYEQFAGSLKKEIGEEYGVPFDEKLEINANQSKAKKLAHAITQHGDSIPKARMVEIYEEIKQQLGKTHITQNDIDTLLAYKVKFKPTHGKRVTDILIAEDGIEDFIIRWRHHFLKTMKPKHLPKYWNPERKLNDRRK